MPVHFAHGSGLDGDEGGGEAAGDGEGLGVEDLDGAAWDAVGLVGISKVRMIGNEVFGYLLAVRTSGNCKCLASESDQQDPSGFASRYQLERGYQGRSTVDPWGLS